jgi:hypothetical protein
LQHKAESNNTVTEKKKQYTARKATGVSVEEFYAAQDEAMKATKTGELVYSLGVRSNKMMYSALILARVEPMPSYEEFREWLDEDIVALVEECKKLNPRHFAKAEDAPVDEKKSAS